MTDHAVFVPTVEGPVGGIVSEPGGEPRAALVLLAGYGRPARSGVNSFWTRTARSLAEHGVVVLRFDYSREGETLPLGEGGAGQIWKRDLDLSLLSQVTVWFRERVGDAPMLLAGSCSGARLAIELAGREPEAFAGTFLVVPYLRALAEPGRERGLESNDLDAVDGAIVDCVRTVLSRGPSWILQGEHDFPDILRLEELLGPTLHDLEVEIVPGAAIHMLDQPDIQEQTLRWLLSRVSRALPAASRSGILF